VDKSYITGFSSSTENANQTPMSKRLNKLTVIGLILIILLGAFLRFYNLGSTGDGNLYYAATVKSMLTSWHNFFYASFEPGGSVSVDKPPLGFWIEALSAKIFGINGFALALPNALAGVLSIPLLFFMLRKQFGAGAGLLAALVLAAAPIAIATDRNNTIDGMLVLVLLLGVWVLLKSIEKGHWGYLVLSMAVVGLAFNIKMLQAYMILPAIYLVYLLFAPFKWWKRIFHLLVGTAALLVVSLAWIVAVDLTPADQRPYVGSSIDNTESELIIGHNGLERLGLNRLLQSVDRGLDDGYPANQAAPAGNDGAGSGFSGNGGGLVPPQGFPPNLGQPGQMPFWDRMNAGPIGGLGVQRQGEVGTAGLLRLFTPPLNDQASWWLPFALAGMILAAILLRWKKPLEQKHIGLILWAAWLLPMVIYFSFTTGLWHTYYLIMLVPGLAGLTGIAAWALWQMLQKKRWLGWGFTFGLTAGTLAFQVIVLLNFPTYALWISLAAGFVWLAGMVLLALQPKVWTLGIVMMGLLVAPITWSFLTTFNSSPNTSLPNAGPVGNNQGWGMNPNNRVSFYDQQTLIDFLLANTKTGSYLVAVPTANEAAPLILTTGRPVLTFGGFLGTDNIIDAVGLAKMVAEGRLRYIIDNDQVSRGKPAIATWIQQNCTGVNLSGSTQAENGNRRGSGGIQLRNGLYDCGNP